MKTLGFKTCLCHEPSELFFVILDKSQFLVCAAWDYKIPEVLEIVVVHALSAGRNHEDGAFA